MVMLITCNIIGLKTYIFNHNRRRYGEYWIPTQPHTDTSKGEEVDSIRDLKKDKKLCTKSDEEPQYIIKTCNRLHQENQVNSVPSDSTTKCATTMGINNKTRTYNKIHQQIHHGNSLHEASTRSKTLSNIKIFASTRFIDAERTGITQLKHHKKVATKSSASSSTSGAVGASNKDTRVQQTQPSRLHHHSLVGPPLLHKTRCRILSLDRLTPTLLDANGFLPRIVMLN